VPIRVVFVAAECEPWAKTGGLADVVDALARTLDRLAGADVERPVDVFLPAYRWIDAASTATARAVVRVPDPVTGTGFSDVGILSVPGDGYCLRLVDHPPAFDRDGVYGPPGGSEYGDNAWRFGLFGRAVIEVLRSERRPVDVIHAHDWHACPTIIARDRWYATDPLLRAAATVLTVHNLSYHGWTPRDDLWQLGLEPGDGILSSDAAGIDLLWTGISRADVVTTVSPGFAAEALTPRHGFGLDGPLRAKGDRFVGILNGLDTSLWDPATDPVIAATYTSADRSGKARCRADLLDEVGFDAGDPSTVLGMVGRLDPQKGFDLLTAAAPAILRLGGRLVVLGTGDPSLVANLRDLAARIPDRIALVEGFDRDLARRIYAGCDLFLMPSRFEPCGQAQMIAMRYGTPPVVHAVGGLRDTVVDEHDEPRRGTGWAFRHPTAAGLAWAAGEAMAAYRAGGERWDGVVGRAMAADFDWLTASGRRYVEAYRRAIELRRGTATTDAVGRASSVRSRPATRAGT
jgi:starch synthase